MSMRRTALRPGHCPDDGASCCESCIRFGHELLSVLWGTADEQSARRLRVEQEILLGKLDLDGLSAEDIIRKALKQVAA